jgi:transcriptional regulator with XRE-family HTH domain
MTSVDRAFDRGSRAGSHSLQVLAEEYREARLAAGLSQQSVADAARISRPRISEIEGGKIRTLTVVEASRIAAVLGLELSVRAYPNGGPTRDAAHADRLGRLLGHVRAPLSYRTEVPLRLGPGTRDQRAWDAMVMGARRVTAVEMEMRIRDGQALERRINLKRRDDPPDRFLLVFADTRTNRRALAASPASPASAALFADLPRLGLSSILKCLEAGEHPPTGLVFA